MSREFTVTWGLEMKQLKPVVAPAWCDPEHRNLRYSWHAVLVGVLYVDERQLNFFAPSGPEVHVVRGECGLQWRRGKGFGLIPSFDLQTAGDTYRFYMSRPWTTAPLFDPRILAQIGEKMSTVGDIGALAGAVGMLGALGGSPSESLEASRATWVTC